MSTKRVLIHFTSSRLNEFISRPRPQSFSRSLHNPNTHFSNSSFVLKLTSSLIINMMQFEYKKFLVVDATSGIGQPLADKFTSNGSYVIVAGCRKENLDAFVEQHKGHASAIQFDITNLDQIKAFSSK